MLGWVFFHRLNQVPCLLVFWLLTQAADSQTHFYLQELKYFLFFKPLIFLLFSPLLPLSFSPIYIIFLFAFYTNIIIIFLQRYFNYSTQKYTRKPYVTK